MHIAALTTCHNRKSTTQKSLDSLKKCIPEAKDVICDIYVFDDGSTDGTLEMLKEHHPDVEVFQGDGTYYWNRGMIQLWKNISKSYDAYLLFNDDVLFYRNALWLLHKNLQRLKKQDNDILAIVGAVYDNQLKATSYGGLRKVARHPDKLKFKHVAPQHTPIKCDTLNMNCALITSETFDKIGFLDSTFHHSFGDLDFGLRIRKAYGSIYLAPNHVGECKINSVYNSWQDPNLGRLNRLKRMNNIKGLPFKERMYYYNKHGGFFWLLFGLAPYIAVFLLNYDTKRINK